MSEIPYLFDLPPPRYFRDNGWFSNPNMVIFIHWAFARCSLQKRSIYYIQKSIELEPFEFIFGRRICSEETGLTEREIRTCIDQLTSGDQQKPPIKKVLLQKTTSKTTNKYTVYRWVTDNFCKTNNQQNDQQTTSRRPADDHNQEDKKIRHKKDHPSIPSESDDLMIDDFSSKIEIYKGIFLTQDELNTCIKIKGNIEKVKQSIEFILNSKKRKHDISDWPNALSKWKIQDKCKINIEENIDYSESLCRSFDDFKKGKGWRCYMYHDDKKDQKGILFECENPHQKPVFIALSDGDFKNKCIDIVTKKMKNTL